jgi:hypothetical protein
MKYGIVGDMVRRVIVWKYDSDKVESLEKEIQAFVPDFRFVSCSVYEVTYSFGENAPVHIWDADFYLVWDSYDERLYRKSMMEVFSSFTGHPNIL